MPRRAPLAGGDGDGVGRPRPRGNFARRARTSTLPRRAGLVHYDTNLKPPRDVFVVH
uniref:Uncharacterized protein n=1 Tax=Setaria italica TaxID=4555 RepID=K3XQ09_SETIT